MKRLTTEEILKKLPEDVSIDMSTYINNKTKARFIHKTMGEWWTLPMFVLNKKTSHPALSKERQKATTIKRYGVEYASQSPVIMEKIKDTNMKNLGVPHPTQSKVVREKIKNKMIKEYGVEHNSQLPEHTNKTKETCRERYGVDNFAKTEQHRLKSRETMNANWRKEEWSNKITLLNQERSKTEEFHEMINKTFSKKESKAEIEIKDYLNSLGFDFKKSFIKIGNKRASIDMLDKNINIAIEYNGGFWHSTKMNKGPGYHLSKTNLCNKKNISLIHIWEYEWIHNIDRVKSYLRSRLGLNLNKIGARECEISEISFADANVLCEKYHLLGKTNQGTLCVGLFYNGDLVSSIIIGSGGRQNSDTRPHLKRFITKESISIAGGLSKMTKFASNLLKNDIITFHELRLGVNPPYPKAGYETISISRPDYFYFNKNKKTLIKKQSRAKYLVNTPEGMTESQHAENDGLLKIYDCGKIKFIYKYKELNANIP